MRCSIYLFFLRKWIRHRMLRASFNTLMMFIVQCTRNASKQRSKIACQNPNHIVKVFQEWFRGQPVIPIVKRMSSNNKRNIFILSVQFYYKSPHFREKITKNRNWWLCCWWIIRRLIADASSSYFSLYNFRSRFCHAEIFLESVHIYCRSLTRCAASIVLTFRNVFILHLCFLRKVFILWKFDIRKCFMFTTRLRSLNECVVANVGTRIGTLTPVYKGYWSIDLQMERHWRKWTWILSGTIEIRKKFDAKDRAHT